MASLNKFSLSDYPEIGILISDPPKILRHPPRGDILWATGNNGLGDNPFGDASDGGPYSGSGSGGGLNPDNWVGPGGGGGGGGVNTGTDEGDATRLLLDRLDFAARMNEILSDFTLLSQYTTPGNSGSPNLDAWMNIITSLLSALGSMFGNSYIKNGKLPTKDQKDYDTPDRTFEGLDWSDIDQLEKRWSNLDTLEAKTRSLLASLQLGLLKVPNDPDGKKLANYIDRLNTILDIIGNEKSALADWLRTHKK